jgi:phospholipid transport system substrate-binding protein
MMTFSRIGPVAVFIFSLYSTPLVAHAREATEQLRATIDAFVAILNSTPVAELRTTGLPENARKLVFARFDFSEMARLSLGRHWKSLSQAEQGEFVDGFTDRLLVSFGKTVRSSNGDKIHFKGEVQEGGQVKLETRVADGTAEGLPVDYRLHDIDGQWKVFDVVIDRVSLVNNFRAQFDRVIAKSSVKELLQRLKQQNS